jgi:hypothetical protein
MYLRNAEKKLLICGQTASRKMVLCSAGYRCMALDHLYHRKSYLALIKFPNLSAPALVAALGGNPDLDRVVIAEMPQYCYTKGRWRNAPPSSFSLFNPSSQDAQSDLIPSRQFR